MIKLEEGHESIPFTLVDYFDEVPGEKVTIPKTIEGILEYEPAGFLFRFQGHGTYVEDGDMGGLIWIEFWEGKIRVHCWNNINEEEAQTIEFQEARVENREEEWEG